MRCLGLVLMLGTVLAGCGASKMQMTPGSRLMYQDDNSKNPIWVVCDRYNLVYLNRDGAFAVVHNGCPDGKP